MKDKTENKWNLSTLIKRGGVYHDVPGNTPKESIAGMIGLLPPDPGLDPQKLLAEILERETFMSTGIGRGIALPHPRNPMPGENGRPLVALAFPREPLDWNTPDGSKVHTFFLIVSVSVKQHLDTLSKINFLCKQEKFYSLIKGRSSKEDIITAIREAETAWEA